MMTAKELNFMESIFDQYKYKIILKEEAIRLLQKYAGLYEEEAKLLVKSWNS